MDESNEGIETRPRRAANHRTIIVAAICPNPTIRNDGNLELEEYA